jgi:hypothetical protein
MASNSFQHEKKKVKYRLVQKPHIHFCFNFFSFVFYPFVFLLQKKKNDAFLYEDAWEGSIYFCVSQKKKSTGKAHSHQSKSVP